MAEHAAGRTRAGLAAELAARLSWGWAAWGRAEAGYETGSGWYGRSLVGIRGLW